MSEEKRCNRDPHPGSGVSPDRLFRKVDHYPPDVSGPSVIVRLLDGLGFRFSWATEGLTAEVYAFSPGEGCQTIAGLVDHIWALTIWIGWSVFGSGEDRPQDPESQRSHVLRRIHRLREHLICLDDRDLAEIQIEGRPFWHLINGPISDALTHVGQINSFRRLAGHPAPSSNPFLCTPPADS